MYWESNKMYWMSDDDYFKQLEKISVLESDLKLSRDQVKTLFDEKRNLKIEVDRLRKELATYTSRTANQYYRLDLFGGSSSITELSDELMNEVYRLGIELANSPMVASRKQTAKNMVELEALNDLLFQEEAYIRALSAPRRFMLSSIVFGLKNINKNQSYTYGNELKTIRAFLTGESLE